MDEFNYQGSYELITPDGELISTGNLIEFCNQHYLKVGDVRRLITGDYKQHRGFQRANDNHVNKYVKAVTIE